MQVYLRIYQCVVYAPCTYHDVCGVYYINFGMLWCSMDGRRDVVDVMF